MTMTIRHLLLPLLLVSSLTALAQQSERFGPYELHYAVVNTTFLQPRVAAAYGITRDKRRAIVNLALREHLPDGSTVARPMLLKGKTRDLIQNQPLAFQEVRESGAIYYLAEFAFINEEWRFFDIYFRPEGTDRTLEFTFRQQLYEDLER
jgi:hypothetical protein